jgi:hypothetical protein
VVKLQAQVEHLGHSRGKIKIIIKSVSIGKIRLGRKIYGKAGRCDLKCHCINKKYRKKIKNMNFGIKLKLN